MVQRSKSRHSCKIFLGTIDLVQVLCEIPWKMLNLDYWMGWEMWGCSKREEIYLYLWLINFEFWQNIAKFCKAITLWLQKTTTATAGWHITICCSGLIDIDDGEDKWFKFGPHVSATMSLVEFFCKNGTLKLVQTENIFSFPVPSLFRMEVRVVIIHITPYFNMLLLIILD